MAFQHKRAKKLVHRSGFEDSVITNLQRFKVPYGYETEVLKYTIPETHHDYTPDVFLDNGIICELKGYMDLETRRKMKFVISQNPHLDIRMVFQEPNNKITKGSKTTYAKWCQKNNIKWGTEADIILWAKEKPKAK